MKVLTPHVPPSIASRPDIDLEAVRARLGENGILLIEMVRERLG